MSTVKEERMLHTLTTKLRAILLFAVLVSLLVCSVQTPPVHCATGTYTTVFTSTTSDGDIVEYNPSYSSCRTSASGTATDDANTFQIGQAPSHYIRRGFVFFETGTLPDSASVESAVLSLYIDTDESTTDFDVQIQSGAPDYPNEPLEDADYYYTHYSGDGGQGNTNGISGVGYWNITLSATGEGWINATDQTVFCLRSEEDVDNSSPSNSESIIVKASDNGSTTAPLLFVTYSVTATYLYAFFGPYTDQPIAVYNGTVTVQVFYNESTSEEYTLDGSTGFEDSFVIASSTEVSLATYNITTTGNYSRTVWLRDSSTVNHYVFVPVDDLPTSQYLFTIIDFQGITGAYLASRLYYNGSWQTVERHSVSSYSDVSMYMQWAVAYDMQLVCNEGTLGFGPFTALGVQTNTYTIPYGTFDVNLTSLNATINALRMNGTHIQMNYTDNEEQTDWVDLVISHYDEAGDWQQDYNVNNTSNSLTVNWYSAIATTDYFATVTFNRVEDLSSYNFTCPAPPSMVNAWAFIPEPYCYVIAVFITISVGLVFSYATIVGGSWAMVGMAGFFTWIGWLPQTTATYSILAGAGLISGLITIAEWKKTVRQI